MPEKVSVPARKEKKLLLTQHLISFSFSLSFGDYFFQSDREDDRYQSSPERAPRLRERQRLLGHPGLPEIR